MRIMKSVMIGFIGIIVGFSAAWLAIGNQKQTTAYFVQTVPDAFVGSWHGPDNDGKYRLQLTPAAIPSEAQTIYKLVSGHKDVVVLVSDKENSFLFHVEELYDDDRLLVRPLTKINGFSEQLQSN